MTIEERARRYSNKLVSDNSYNGYITGATDQKAIDDKLITKLKESWEKESEINHDAAAHYEQGWHDAVEWACEFMEESKYRCSNR